MCAIKYLTEPIKWLKYQTLWEKWNRKPPIQHSMTNFTIATNKCKQKLEGGM